MKRLILFLVMFAHRSGLEARYTVPNLSFRTALDAPVK